jgi:two-component system chemotaxis response regulator CheY
MGAFDVDFERLSVLVVEDDGMSRRVLSEQLKSLGVNRIIEAVNGVEALNYLQKTTPNIVLCDIGLAHIDGIKVLRAVRTGKVGHDRRLPFVLITGNTEKDTVLAAKELLADGYMVKPVALHELNSKISDVIVKRRMQKAN